MGFGSIKIHKFPFSKFLVYYLSFHIFLSNQFTRPQFWELWIYNTALLCDRGEAGFQSHANDIKFKHFGKQNLTKKIGVSYLRHFGNHLKPILNIDDFIWIGPGITNFAFDFIKPHLSSCNRIENHRYLDCRKFCFFISLSALLAPSMTDIKSSKLAVVAKFCKQLS